MALKHAPRIVTDGLVLALDAANPKSYPGSGTTWKDLSGNGNDGTLVNGTNFNGNGVSSMSFDGTNDQISCGLSGGSLNVQFTYIIWFKFTTGTRTIGSGRKDILYGIDYARPHLTFDREGDGKFGSYPFKGSNKTIKSTTDVWNNNQWYMIATTGDSARDRIYVNGVMETEILSSGTYTSWSTFNFSLANSQAFPGEISLVNFYNYALTATEIQQNYNATKSRFYDI